MRLVILVSLLFSLTACANMTTKDKFPNVDDRLQEYVMRFDYYLYKYQEATLDTDIKVYIAPVTARHNAVGVYNRTTNTTTISSSYWYRLSELEKEEVIFHELGHHVLKLSHDWSGKNLFKDGCPKSIMYYQMISPSCYRERQSYYRKELFLRDK